MNNNFIIHVRVSIQCIMFALNIHEKIALLDTTIKLP